MPSLSPETDQPLHRSRGEPLNKKTPVLLTTAVLLMGMLAGITIMLLPESDAPQVSFSLYDTDGIKTVALGETAEYIIRVDNLGRTTGHFYLSTRGEAQGWTSGISHDVVHLPAGEHQLISLYVTPQDIRATPSINVNVVATRSGNETLVGTTTYLKGLAEFRRAGEDPWRMFTTGSSVHEGDEVRTGASSFTQLDFSDSGDISRINMALEPRSHILFESATSSGGMYPTHTFRFHLGAGTMGCSVNLPDDTWRFELALANGASVHISSPGERVFVAEAAGMVRVFEGSLIYREGTTRNPSGVRADLTITQGQASDGGSFHHSVISLPNNGVNPRVQNVHGATLGFENSGDFVSDGTINGFLLRGDTRDRFFLEGGDATYTHLVVSRDAHSPVDVHATIHSPEPRTFRIVNIDTPSTTLNLQFGSDRVSIHTSSETTYDLEITNWYGKAFTVTGLTLGRGQGHSFRVEDFGAIDDTIRPVVVFGLDRDGDGRTDRSVAVTTGMTGSEIGSMLEDEDDEEMDSLWYAIIVVMIIMAIFVLTLVAMGSRRRRPRIRMEREEEYRRKRAALLETARAAGIPMWAPGSPDMEPEPMPGMEPGPMIPPTPTRMEPEPAVTSARTRMEPGPVVVHTSTRMEPAPAMPPAAHVPVVETRDYTPEYRERSPPTAVTRKPAGHRVFAPEEITDPSRLADFAEEVERPELREIDEMLRTQEAGTDIPSPAEKRAEVEKYMRDLDEWWEEWDRELDEILKL